jgi:hypothetical protein
VLPALGCRLIVAGIPGQLAAVALFFTVYVGAWRVLGLDPADRAVFLAWKTSRS